jgi:hypothetical protein
MLTNRAGIQERGECSEQTQLYPLSNERHFRDVLEPAVPAPSSSAAWGGGLHEALRRRHSRRYPLSTHSKPPAPDQRFSGRLGWRHSSLSFRGQDCLRAIALPVHLAAE